MCAGKTALSTCCRWVMQHADALVQELRLLDRQIEDKSNSAGLQKKLSDKEQHLQNALEANSVRQQADCITCHLAAHICAAWERLPLRATGCK